MGAMKVFRIVEFQYEDPDFGLLDYQLFSYEGCGKVGYVANKAGTKEAVRYQIESEISDIQDEICSRILAGSNHMLFDKETERFLLSADRIVGPGSSLPQFYLKVLNRSVL